MVTASVPEVHLEPALMLVTGGTGTLGRLVVERLVTAGQRVRVLARGRHEDTLPKGVEFAAADLSTGADVDQALRDCDVVVHLAGAAKGDDVKARTLVSAAARSGVRHVVYITVVGDEAVPMRSAIDRAMFGYFGAKAEAERIVRDSGVPWTTLHATQFYDTLLKTIEQMAKFPIVFAPAGIRFQPIDPGEVADRLVELALGEPAGRVPDMGGPRAYELSDLVRAYLRERGSSRPILSLPVPGAAAKAIRAGATLTPDRAVGRRTWEEFLAARVGSRSRGRPSRAPARR